MTKDILQQFDEKFWYLWKVHEDGSQVTVHEDVKSFLEEALKAQKKKIKEMIGNIELDKKAHSQGKCSFKSMAVCSAEEQEIKMSLLKAIDKL